MKNIAAPKRWRKRFFDFVHAKRRSEIVKHARYVGAADTADFERWLVQWAVHNPGAKDEIWAVMRAAEKMGGTITEGEAASICDEAALYEYLPKADALAKVLGLTYDVRQKLGITTIGATDIKAADREEIRRVRHRVKQEARRRTRGCKPRAEYEANSLSRTEPWRKAGMSRAQWYRQRTKDETSPCTTSLAIAANAVVSTERAARVAEGASPPSKEERGLATSQSATPLAADIHVRVPHWCFGRKPDIAENRAAA